MKQYKKYYVFAVLFFIIVLLSIGFAYLSTTLNINGSSSIHDASWDIHFENVQVTSGSVPADEPEIDSLETTVTYDVTLTNPGDYFEFTVDAVNDGTIDAMIDTVLSTLNNTEVTTLPNYLEYSVTYSDDNAVLEKQELNAGEHETYKVRVGYKKDITSSDLPVVEQDLSFSFTVTYVQKDSTAISILRPVSFGTDSWETIIGAVRSGRTDKYHVGDTKDVDMGSLGTKTVRIINMSTPEICSSEGYSQSACGFVLEFVEPFSQNGYMNSSHGNTGGWPATQLRSYLNNTFYQYFPSPVKEAILDTYVVSSKSNYTGSGELFTSTDKVYISSYCELMGLNSRMPENDYTREFDFYVQHSNASYRLKMDGSTCVDYFLRSSYYNINGFYVILENGGDAGMSADSFLYYVPIFRIG